MVRWGHEDTPKVREINIHKQNERKFERWIGGKLRRVCIVCVCVCGVGVCGREVCVCVCGGDGWVEQLYGKKLRHKSLISLSKGKFKEEIKIH